jgi:hypothetical protein
MIIVIKPLAGPLGPWNAVAVDEDQPLLSPGSGCAEDALLRYLEQLKEGWCCTPVVYPRAHGGGYEVHTLILSVRLVH